LRGIGRQRAAAQRGVGFQAAEAQEDGAGQRVVGLFVGVAQDFGQRA
jgi:hypothetical protein